MLPLRPTLRKGRSIARRRLLGVPRHLKSCNQVLPRPGFPALPHRRHTSGREEASGDTAKSSPFPWRHNRYVLPRVELEMLSHERSGWKSRLASVAWEKGTLVLMRKPFHVILGYKWREDLVNNCAWVFTSGVAGLLSSTFKGTADYSITLQPMKLIPS